MLDGHKIRLLQAKHALLIVRWSIIIMLAFQAFAVDAQVIAQVPPSGRKGLMEGPGSTAANHGERESRQHHTVSLKQS